MKLQNKKLFTFTRLSTLEQYIINGTENESLARYFKVGDTPSEFYVIDPGNYLNDPPLGNWVCRFLEHFPKERLNYHTIHN